MYGYYVGFAYKGWISKTTWMWFPTEQEYIDYMNEKEVENDDKRKNNESV